MNSLVAEVLNLDLIETTSDDFDEYSPSRSNSPETENVAESNQMISARGIVVLQKEEKFVVFFKGCKRSTCFSVEQIVRKDSENLKLGNIVKFKIEREDYENRGRVAGLTLDPLNLEEIEEKSDNFEVTVEKEDTILIKIRNYYYQMKNDPYVFHHSFFGCIFDPNEYVLPSKKYKSLRIVFSNNEESHNCAWTLVNLRSRAADDARASNEVQQILDEKEERQNEMFKSLPVVLDIESNIMTKVSDKQYDELGEVRLIKITPNFSPGTICHFSVENTAAITMRAHVSVIDAEDESIHFDGIIRSFDSKEVEVGTSNCVFNELKIGGLYIFRSNSAYEKYYKYYESNTHDENTLLQRGCVVRTTAEDGMQFMREQLPAEKGEEKQTVTRLYVEEKISEDPEIPFETELNEYQKQAVRMAINPDRKIVFIQGPPGTGKTKTLADIVCAYIKKDEKIFICTPSHAAKDNILEAVRKRAKELNLYDPESDKAMIVKREDIEEMMKGHRLAGYLAETREAERNARYEEEREDVRKQIRKILRAMQTDILVSTKALFSTITASFLSYVERFCRFTPNVMVVDEAAQMPEAFVWPAAHFLDKIIFAGDQQQLPTVVLSNLEESQDFKKSFMERFHIDNGNESDKNSITLLIQYRMNKNIMKWPSTHFYDKKLIADSSVENIQLRDLFPDLSCDNRFKPFIFIDTDKARYDKRPLYAQQKVESSFKNDGEAALVIAHTMYLISKGITEDMIAIITPYTAQKNTIQRLLAEANLSIRCDSVDAFQGQESEVVIFSLVRKDPNGLVGFLSETRRLNVAITRAKRQFCLVGSGATLNSSGVDKLANLAKYIRNYQKIISPMIYTSDQEQEQPRAEENANGVNYCQNPARDSFPHARSQHSARGALRARRGHGEY